MASPTRTPLSWRTVLAIVGGMGLIGWAVDDALSWLQQTGLIFGVLLIAYGMASARPTPPA